MVQASRLKIYVVILVLFFAEVVLFGNLRIFGARPSLLLITTLFFGFNFGMARGAEVGLVSGVLTDMLSIGSFGINTFSFLLAGSLSGYLKDKLFRDNFVTQFFLSNVSIYLIAGVYFLYFDKILKTDPGAGFLRLSLAKGLYTGLLAPILFFILTMIFRARES
ncbi:rod shape-determining protein MreD [Candidatus Omnitrophota bacterium]